ncbi:MAG: pyrroline-5-carboxylate reductase, partial [Gammaproteobacteria bacterium]
MGTNTITFIGGGNMARSLIGGLITDGYDPSLIRVADPDAEARGWFSKQFGLHSTSDNPDAAQGSDVVVMAVKPQALQSVAQELADTLQESSALVITIAAGIRETDLNRWMGGGLAVVRAMPNTPALVQSGATALYANPQVSEQQKDLAESILRAVGLTLWLEDESQMDAVTALSGSGPAYFFLVMEALQAAGEQLGLPADSARLLTLQTAFGSAKMALESAEDVAVLRQRVTSPGGTTEQALKVLEQGNMRTLWLEALQAAQRRSKELAD